MPPELFADNGLRLTCEPIPRTTANLSLNQATSRKRWQRLRKAIAADYGWQCAVCGMDPKYPPRPPEPKDVPLVEAPWVESFQAAYEAGERSSGNRSPVQKMRLECHEVWYYDHDALVQRLAGLIPLCTLCHQVKHWQWIGRYRDPHYCQSERELALYLASSWDRVTLEQHFMQINECDLALMRAYIGELGIIHRWRSRYEWTVDFGQWSDLVEQNRVEELRVWNAGVQERINETLRLAGRSPIPRED